MLPLFSACATSNNCIGVLCFLWWSVPKCSGTMSLCCSFVGNLKQVKHKVYCSGTFCNVSIESKNFQSLQQFRTIRWSQISWDGSLLNSQQMINIKLGPIHCVKLGISTTDFSDVDSFIFWNEYCQPEKCVAYSRLPTPADTETSSKLLASGVTKAELTS